MSRDTYYVIQILGFATGSVLSVLLMALGLKAVRLWSIPRSRVVAAALGLFWNAGNLVKNVALVMGVNETAMICRLSDLVAYLAAALLPTAFLILLEPLRWTRAWQRRAYRWLRYLSYANAAWLMCGFIAATLLTNFPITFPTFMRLTAYNLMLHVALCLIVFRGTRPDTRARLIYSRAMLAVWIGLAITTLFEIHVVITPSAGMVLTVITEQAWIPFVVISFVFLAQFRFTDLLVKRSLTICCAVVAILIYWVFIVAPALRMVREAAAYPEVGSLIAVTVLWFFFVMPFPVLKRKLEFAVDRWLFRRPDYRQLAHTFAQQSESSGSEEELFAAAEQMMHTALSVASARVMPRTEIENDPMTPLPGEVIQLSHDHPARGLLGKPDVEWLLPIQSEAVVSHFLVIAPGQQGRRLLSDELAFLSTLAERTGRRLEALHFERERRERELREARLQHSLTQAELKALRAQVNPHFLFNTLSTIVELIGSAPEKAELMTERLAEVFRYALAQTDRSLIPVSEELEFLRTYLALEQTRFGDRLQVELTADPAVRAELIPPLILQPLVENAIKHGLAPKPGCGAVSICAVDEGQRLRLEVEDNGVGWRDHAERLPAARGGVGLRNVRERLRTLYGEQAELTIRSEDGLGTCVSVWIPKRETQNLNHR